MDWRAVMHGALLECPIIVSALGTIVLAGTIVPQVSTRAVKLNSALSLLAMSQQALPCTHPPE